MIFCENCWRPKKSAYCHFCKQKTYTEDESVYCNQAMLNALESDYVNTKKRFSTYDNKISAKQRLSRYNKLRHIVRYVLQAKKRFRDEDM